MPRSIEQFKGRCLLVGGGWTEVHRKSKPYKLTQDEVYMVDLWDGTDTDLQMDFSDPQILQEFKGKKFDFIFFEFTFTFSKEQYIEFFKNAAELLTDNGVLLYVGGHGQFFLQDLLSEAGFGSTKSHVENIPWFPPEQRGIHYCIASKRTEVIDEATIRALPLQAQEIIFSTTTLAESFKDGKTHRAEFKPREHKPANQPSQKQQSTNTKGGVDLSTNDLYLAIQQKDNLRIEDLLENHHADANKIDPTRVKLTPFRLACSTPEYEQQALYILRHRKFTLPNNFTDLLVLACQRGQFYLVRALWEKAEAERKNRQLTEIGTLALYEAVEAGNRKTAEFLLKKGADYTKLSVQTKNKLDRLVIPSDTKTSKKHFDQPLVNELHYKGTLPLEFAIQQKDNLRIEDLLENHHANANEINRKKGNLTPFRLACSNPEYELQAIYILNHRKFTLPDNFTDLLVLGCQRGQYDLVRALWERAEGAGKNKQLTEIGAVALHEAVKAGNRKTAEFLLKKGADYTKLSVENRNKLDKLVIPNATRARKK